MSMQNFVFRCDTDEKNQFMVDAERMGLDSSFLMRRMVHLFLCDKYLRQRVLNIQSEEESHGWEF